MAYVLVLALMSAIGRAPIQGKDIPLKATGNTSRVAMGSRGRSLKDPFPCYGLEAIRVPQHARHICCLTVCTRVYALGQLTAHLISLVARLFNGNVGGVNAQRQQLFLYGRTCT